MAVNKDWLPTNREGQLAMAKVWITILKEKGDGWRIPSEAVLELERASYAADRDLADAKNEAARTPVVTARCRESFKRLEDVMRDIKKRYLFVPPLTDADIVSFGLKLRDTTMTQSGVPTAQATIETYLVGRHELGVKIIYVTGAKHDAANKGYRIYYSVLAHDAPAPGSPDDLRKSFFTKRLKDVIEFDFNDSGKTVYMAVQIENEGKKGPWGPLVSALIP